jgi:hypothetical protein
MGVNHFDSNVTFFNQNSRFVIDFADVNFQISFLNEKYNAEETRINSGHALGLWIRRCSLFHRRELWVSKSVGVNST